jgi:membrane protease YdiL (CAAX protease family)
VNHRKPLDDLRAALALSGPFGVLAALTVPVMLDSLPPQARALPLPVPAFAAILGVQGTVVYGLFALAGLRLARRVAFDPTPRLDGPIAAAALGTGLACGALLVTVMALIRRLAPETLPQMLHPPSVPAALLASAAASFGEEILCRLFLLTGLLYLLRRFSACIPTALVFSSLAFAALHAPAAVFQFGGVGSVPSLSWVWIMLLNGLLGAVFGVLYLRRGIAAAVLGHFGTDLVWHVATQVV